MRRLFPALLVALCCGLPSQPLLAAEDSLVGSSVLLVAAEGMEDPRFHQSVVLVTRHGRNRATVGVIVNRALDIALDRVFPDLTQAAQHRLHYGGPVALGQIVFLVRSEAAPAASIALAERLFLSSDGDSLRQLLGAPTPASRLRVFNGFASWAPDQLENEIDRGDWYLLPMDADALFSDSLDKLWEKLWRRATQLRVQVPQFQAAPARRPLGDGDYIVARAGAILGRP